jgi:hypothetical protein
MTVLLRKYYLQYSSKLTTASKMDKIVKILDKQNLNFEMTCMLHAAIMMML